MKKKLITSSLIGLTLLFSSISRADYNNIVNQDKYLTDTATGFNWLHLSETVNLSFDYVSSQLGSGGLFEGYRYARLDELGGLLNDLRTYPSPYIGSPDYDLSNHSDVVLNFISYMGETGFLNDNYGEYTQRHWSSGFIDPNSVSLNSFIVGPVAQVALIQREFHAAIGDLCYPTECFSGGQVGSFLVAVPEPSEYALLIAGFGIIGFVVRRHNGQQA
jgi:hypothetical protein